MSVIQETMGRDASLTTGRRLAALPPRPFGPTLLCVALLAVLAGGCSRAFYRQQADEEVYCLENQGSQAVGDTEGALPIEPPPASRMFDPNCPDRPPMPPDDPVSNRLMHCVDGKRGWPGWDRCYGKTCYVANPNWEAYLPRDAEGQVVLDREAAMRLALCNAPEFQTQLENLYLSALDVTFQRFRFDAQFFGGNDTFFDAQGRDFGGGRSQSILSTDTDVLMRKMSATGGELVVGAANSLVWQFAGADDYNGTTLLNFEFIQPLLRAGGRAVVLEALTDAERALVANVRQMDRFRCGFYAQVVAGRSPGTGPQPGGITLGSLSPGGGGAVGGLIALLRQQVLIRNQRANVVALRDSLEQLKAFFNANQVDFFQVEQTRLTLYNAEIQLLNLQNQYKNGMDLYKVQLGLPPDLTVLIHDPLLDRFELISADLTEAQDRVTTLLANLRDPELRSILSEDVRQIEPIIAVCREQIGRVQQDMRKLDEALPTRKEHLRLLARRPAFRDGDVDASIASTALLDERVSKVKTQFAELRLDMERTFAGMKSFDQGAAEEYPESGFEERDLRTQIAAVEEEIAQRKPNAAEENALREKIESLEEAVSRARLKGVVQKLSGQMLLLSLCQAEARLDALTLKPLNLDPRDALRIARANRQDWKNARAALVDQWRQIEVVANELESDLDIVFGGDLRTIGGNPTRFRGTNGRLRVGFEFDAPLTRLAERNAYREALINYQQARRQYYTYEDEVYRVLRTTLRAIQLAQINFEQRRAAVYVAATQVDLKQYDMLHKPPQVGRPGLGDVAARDVIDAINNLLSQQNDFLGVWVDYEVQRLNLAFDLGTMKLDDRGMWIDENSFEDDLAQTDGAGPEPGVDCPELIEPGPVTPDAPEGSVMPELEPVPAPAAEPEPPSLRPVAAAASAERVSLPNPTRR